MKSIFRIGWRAAFSCALVFAVLFVPLLHSAHFHEGSGDGDASVSATCVACQATGSYVADSSARTDLCVVVGEETVPGVESSPCAPPRPLATAPQRAPPSSLS